MQCLDRRSLLLGGAALVSSPAIRRASAAEFVFKVAHNLGATHPTNIRLQQAGERILAESGGRLELQLFPNSQLGGESQLLNQVRSGAIDMFLVGGLVISSVLPVAGINGTAFAFKDYDAVWQAMDGKLGAHVRDNFSKIGLRTPPRMWDLGFRHVTNSMRPVEQASDLGGLKIRVPSAAGYVTIFKALDAAPVSMQFPEVYVALQTRVVDGQENSLPLISDAKFYEVQKYCSLTAHIWEGFWPLTNLHAWRGLPTGLQEVFDKIFDEVAIGQRADVAKLDRDLRTGLASKIAINVPDPASFRKKLIGAGYYKDARARYGETTWNILREYASDLG